jgi:hypothetical protein
MPNPPPSPFIKGGNDPSLWQREVGRDLIIERRITEHGQEGGVKSGRRKDR